MKPVKQTCSRSDVISTLLGNIALQRDAAPVCLHNGRSWLFMLGVCYASISALQLADRHRLFCPKQGPSTSKLDWRVSDQKAAKELANIIRQLRVGTRRATFQIHRRKAALEVSLPGSRHSSLSAGDPEEPFAPAGVERQVSESSGHVKQPLNGSASSRAELQFTQNYRLLHNGLRTSTIVESVFSAGIGNPAPGTFCPAGRRDKWHHPPTWLRERRPAP